MSDGGKPSLEAVLEHYEVDTQGGRRRMVPCPLHEDRNPSCSVNWTKGVWRCHSCGKGGDSITLIEIKEGVDYGGALGFAASHGFADGGAGDSGLVVRGSAYGGRRTVARGKGSRPAGGGYKPSWRRG